ncbi:MAG: helix-turn-helix transcriptional regulator [Halobacteriota archaeon]
MDDTETKEEKQAVHEILRLLACSDLRKNLAEALREGKKLTLSELSEQVGASSPAAVHALRELGKEGLIRQDERRNYSLTNIGEIVIRKSDEINLAILALVHNKNFWLEHDLSGLPTNLLDRVACLADGTVLISTPTDLFKVFSTFYMGLENAKEIRGVSPIFIEELTNQFVKLVGKDIKVELVVTTDVLDQILKTADQAELKKALKTNLKLFKIGYRPSVAFTVTDYFLQLGFFRQDGTYDWSNDLLTYGAEALEWGRDLFSYYVKQTEPVVL